MSFAQYGLGYPGLSAPQPSPCEKHAADNHVLPQVNQRHHIMMVGSGMQPNSHTPTCDVAHARPFMADPHTGQTICSCQYDRFMRSCFPSPTSAGFAPFPSTPGNDHPAGMPPGMGPYHPGSNHPSHDSISMYAAAGLSGPFSDPKDPGCDNAAAAAWRAAIVAQNGASAAACYPYDPSFGGAGMYSSGPYCGNNFSMDPAGLNRRKNATRETTSQLKHWLSEHRKNPYPTKGEKIMLAIVTKMTLTQVSTWFANARRRLKKENKMTWSPRNRGCEDDDKSDDQGGNDDDPDDFPDKDDESLSVTGSLTEDDVKRPDSLSPSVSDSKDHIQNQIQSATPTTLTSSTPLNASSKPRIWSLADLAAAPAPVPPQTQSATKSHLSTNPQLDACPPFPFTTQQMSVQTSNSNQQNHGHAAYFGRTGAGPGGPMMGPGGPGMHARPPLPGWPGLFPGSVVAAATASSIMQSNSLINAHHAGTFFSRNPNSAFSAPGQGFPGSLGLSLPHSNPMPRPVNRISSRNSTVEIEKSDNGEPQVKRRSSSTDKVMLRDSSPPPGDKTGSPLAGKRQSSHSPIDVIVPADVNATSTVTGSPTLHNSKKRKRSSSSDNSVVSA